MFSTSNAKPKSAHPVSQLKLARRRLFPQTQDRMEKLRAENKRYRETNRAAEFEAHAAKLRAQVSRLARLCRCPGRSHPSAAPGRGGGGSKNSRSRLRAPSDCVLHCVQIPTTSAAPLHS